MKTLYEIIKNTREVKKPKEITSGVTLAQDDYSPEIIKSFDTKKDAIKELEKYASKIDELSGSNGKFYSVTEYYIQENIYDDEDEWRDGGNIWAFAPFKISLVSKPEYETINIFDNMEDALNALNEHNGDCYLSFN